MGRTRWPVEGATGLLDALKLLDERWGLESLEQAFGGKAER
jgi:hypothetical protein